MSIISTLKRIIEENKETSSDYKIATFLLKSAYNLDNLSLKVIAYNSNCSISKVQRFIKNNFDSTVKFFVFQLNKEDSNNRLLINQKDVDYDKFILPIIYDIEISGKQSKLKDKFNLCIEKIVQARKIIFIGNNNSQVLNYLFSTYLTRIGLYSYSSIHIHDQMSLIKIATPNDIVICSSYSGDNKDLIKLIKLANKKQIYTISLTSNDNNSIKKLSDLNISLISNDQMNRYLGISSTIIFILFQKYIILKLINNNKNYKNLLIETSLFD